MTIWTLWMNWQGENFENSLEAYRSRLVIWSASMEKPVRVDKVCKAV